MSSGTRRAAAELERRWVILRNSSRWRRLHGAALSRRLQTSAAGRRLGVARRSLETTLRHRADPTGFRTVQTFCLFLGTVKSGGTLLGAMLDAHPRIVLADEVDPLRYLDEGFSREQVFHLLAKGARREALKGRVTARRLEPYSLAVPGQHQGRGSAVAVMGDSRAGPTTRLLGRRPDLLDELRTALGDVDDRYVHVVRDPHDPISAMVVRGRRTLDDAIGDYAAQCRRVELLRAMIGPERIHTVHYEDLLTAPEAVLASTCAFLGVGADAGHLAACSAIVDSSRAGERRWVEWNPSAREQVRALVEEIDFLRRYGADFGATDAAERGSA
jgi:hypothetical protein